MSDDPVRLVDDPTFADALRADVRRVAAAPGPRFDEAAGLARLTAALGALPPAGGAGGPQGAPPAGGASGAGTAAAGAKAGGVLTSGVFLGFVGAGLVGAALVWVSPIGEPREPAARVSAPLAASSAATEAEPAPAVAAAPATADLPDRAPADPRTPAAGHDVPQGSASPSELALETEDLGAIRVLAQRDPAGALDRAAAGSRRFPRGLFGLEREAISIAALARLGRAEEARRRAEAFVAAHPRSVFAEQIRKTAGLAAP